MNRHLVAVEVGVESSASKRMKFYGSAFDKYRLKRLNTESVKCRSTVKQYRVIFNYVFENIPYLIFSVFYKSFRTLYIMAKIFLNQSFHNERFEKFQRHFFRKPALIKFKFRSDDDNRTSRIVDTFTEKILTETALFTAEHSAERFKVTAARSRYGFASTAVIDKSVNCFLQHSLFVADDDIRSTELGKFLKTVITIYNSAVQIVKVACRISAAVKLNHRTEFRRKNRKNVENHPFRTVAGDTECFDNFKSLNRFKSLLTRTVFNDGFKFHAVFFKVDFLQKLFNGFGAHSDSETSCVIFILFKDCSLNLIGNNRFFGYSDYFFTCRSFVDFNFRYVARVKNNEGNEIQNLFEFFWRHIQKQRNSARNASEIPYMGNRSSKLDMSHSFTTDFAFSNFNAALFAYYALIAYSLILSAMAFPVTGRSEDFFAE